MHEDLPPTSHSDKGKSEAKAPSLTVATLSMFDIAEGFKPVVSRKKTREESTSKTPYSEYIAANFCCKVSLEGDEAVLTSKGKSEGRQAMKQRSTGKRMDSDFRDKIKDVED